MTTMVRRENSQRPTRSAENAWDPFRLMDSMLRWEPFSSLMPSAGTAASQVYMPKFDVKETKDGYVFTADLPGIKEADLDISLTGNQLVISGKRDLEETKESEQYHLYERSYGQFSRSFALPEGVNPDSVSAHLRDGVLTLTVGKRPEVQPRRIQLSAKPHTSA